MINPTQLKWMTIGAATMAMGLIFFEGRATRAPSSAPVPNDNAPVRITLVGLNDLHGNIEAKEVTVGVGKGAKSAKVGGVEALGAYLDIVRNQNPDGTLVLDSGDAFQGTLISNYFQGLSVVASYNALHIDASTFGNHEFDYGDVKDKPVGAPVDPQGSTRQILSKAQYPYLTVNVLSEKTGKPIDFPNTFRSRIFEKAGIKIGVIGATTVTTPSEASPLVLKGLKFKRLKDTVPTEAVELRRRGANLVVLIAHAGGRCDMQRPSAEGDTACASSKDDEVTELLKTAPGIVDVVMAGHVHLPQAHLIQGVPVVQTFGLGTSFSKLDIWVNPKASSAAARADRIVNVALEPPTYLCWGHFANYASCSPDELKIGGSYPTDLGIDVPATFMGQPLKLRSDLTLTIAPFKREVEQLMNRKLVELPKELPWDRTRESAIADCVADVAKEEIEQAIGEKLDGLVTHSGGIRAPLAKGSVNYGQVFSVLPFDEGMGVVTISGQELEEFGTVLSNTPKSVAVVSEGWKVRLSSGTDFPKHRGFILPSGQPVDAHRSYRIATAAFNVASGGGNESIFGRVRSRGDIRDLPTPLRDLFANRLARKDKALPKSCQGAALDRTVMVEKEQE